MNKYLNVSIILFFILFSCKTTDNRIIITSAEVEANRNRERPKYEKRSLEDHYIYNETDIENIDKLYDINKKKWGSDEVKNQLNDLIKKYPDSNRAGCALLYLAHMVNGNEKKILLEQCIEKYFNTFYGDGTQVGVYAMYVLGVYYLEIFEREKARKLFDEIVAKYPTAIDHHGVLLVDKVPSYKDSK